MVSIAALESLHEDALDAADGLGIVGEARPRTFAVMVAAFAAEGWRDSAADDLLDAAMGGWTHAELAAAKVEANFPAPWAEWDEAPDESRAAARRLTRGLREYVPPGGARFAFAALPAPPKWVVPDFLVRGKAHMLSGPTHAFKTGLREAMMAASLTGRPFLGREVPRLRWMVLDGENSRADILSRWRALGITDEHRFDIYLAPREANMRLGDEVWDSWLTREAEAFEPDVLVIDTVARVCAGVAVNDNDRVAALYADVLVPLVDRHDLALLFTHHARKSGGKAGTDDAALGAAAWAGQAEQTLTIATTGKLKLIRLNDGSSTTSRPFVLRRPKGRDLVSNDPEHFEVRGRFAPNGVLNTLEAVLPAAEPTLVQRLVAALEAPLGAPALAQAMELNRTGTKFRKALDDALGEALVAKLEDGRYARA